MDSETNLSEVSSNERKLQNFHLLTPFDPGTGEVDLNLLYEKVHTQRYAFDDASWRAPAQAFVQALMTPNSMNFYNPDLGWCLVRDLGEYTNPDIHFVVWNKAAKISEIKQAGREVISWIFANFKCNRITAMIPEFNDGAKRFATILRFQYEGSMKGATLYEGKWRNVEIYGLLRNTYLEVQ